MKDSPRADNMGVASREDKSAMSIERSTIPGVEGMAEHTMMGKTCIGESEIDVEQTITGTALIMSPRRVFLSVPLHG